MSKCIVIGGGAAGMLAAYSAAVHGHQVTLLEKNEKLAFDHPKVIISGIERLKLFFFTSSIVTTFAKCSSSL